MVLLLHVLGYVAAAAALLFVTLSLASGLLWLSEIIEEHSRTSKTIGVRGTYTIIGIHVLLWLFDGLPLPRIAFSILCHLIYLTNFSPAWPLVSLTSYSFLGSCFMVLVDHFIWFTYFSARTAAARQSIRKFGSTDWRPATGAEGRHLSFLDIVTFFGVCVWLVPLFLFLSLSANDNALPSSYNDPQTPSVIPPSASPTSTTFTLNQSTSSQPSDSYFERVQSNSPLLLSTSSRPPTLIQRFISPILTPVISLFPRRRRRGADRDDTDGLIAPVRTKSPLPSPLHSPLHSPRMSPEPPVSPMWLNGPPKSPTYPNGHGNGHDAPGLGYGRLPTPFLQPPPTRRATTGGEMSPNRSAFAQSVPPSSPRKSNLGPGGSGLNVSVGYGRGQDSSRLRAGSGASEHGPNGNGAEPVGLSASSSSMGRLPSGGISGAGRRRVAGNGDVSES